MKNSKKLESVKNKMFAVNIQPIIGGMANDGVTIIFTPKGKSKDN